jgi:hypothetical protein
MRNKNEPEASTIKHDEIIKQISTYFFPRSILLRTSSRTCRARSGTLLRSCMLDHKPVAGTHGKVK